MAGRQSSPDRPPSATTHLLMKLAAKGKWRKSRRSIAARHRQEGYALCIRTGRKPMLQLLAVSFCNS
jgi:hypothetical protein